MLAEKYVVLIYEIILKHLLNSNYDRELLKE